MQFVSQGGEVVVAPGAHMVVIGVPSPIGRRRIAVRILVVAEVPEEHLVGLHHAEDAHHEDVLVVHLPVFVVLHQVVEHIISERDPAEMDLRQLAHIQCLALAAPALPFGADHLVREVVVGHVVVKGRQVPVLLAADEAEIAVFITEKEDVGADVEVVLDPHYALVGDAELDLAAVHVRQVVPKERVAALLLSEVEGEVLAVENLRDGDDQVLDAVLVDVSFGYDRGAFPYERLVGGGDAAVETLCGQTAGEAAQQEE